MEVKIASTWKSLLSEEFDKPYFRELTSFVRDEYKTQTIYPRGLDIFKAFDRCDFDNVKVVIIGQDPYHGPGQTNGLCFSVCDGMRFPPSLLNIFKEIREDLGKPIPTSGDLERWAKQGVLLLNATLTVKANSPGSHQNKGWETFTDAVIKKDLGRKGRYRLFAVGRLCPEERRDHRQEQTPRSHVSPPFTVFSGPGILRMQTFQQGKRLSQEQGQAGDRLVNKTAGHPAAVDRSNLSV